MPPVPTEHGLQPNRVTRFLWILCGCMCVFLVITMVATYLPFADDWHHTFRPATLHLLAGESPYDSGTFYSLWVVVAVRYWGG